MSNIRPLTFSHVLALLIFGIAISLLTSSVQDHTTLRYFALFWPDSQFDPKLLAWGMLLSSLLMFFRRSRAQETVLLLSPVTIYAFMVVWVTLVHASPEFPPVRAIFWLSIPALAAAHLVDITRVSRSD